MAKYANRIVYNYDGRSQAYKVQAPLPSDAELIEKAIGKFSPLFGELAARGFDMKTLRFEIKKGR